MEKWGSRSLGVEYQSGTMEMIVNQDVRIFQELFLVNSFLVIERFDGLSYMFSL